MNRFRSFISSFFTRKKKKIEEADEPVPQQTFDEVDFPTALREKLLVCVSKLPYHLNQTFEVMRRSDLFFEEANYETGKEFENSVEVLLGEFKRKLEGKNIGFEFIREDWIGLDKRVDFLLKFRVDKDRIFEMMVECKYSSKEGDGEYLESFMNEACDQLKRYYEAQEKKSHLLVCLVNFKLKNEAPYLLKDEVLVINLHAFSYLLFVLLAEMEKG